MYEIFDALCRQHNVTPYKVSKETGISQPSLSDWKRGISVPKVDKLQKIAAYFNVSVNYLLGEEEQKENPASVSSDEVNEWIEKTVDLLNKVPDDQFPVYYAMIEAALKAQGLL